MAGDGFPSTEELEKQVVHGRVGRGGERVLSTEHSLHSVWGWGLRTAHSLHPSGVVPGTGCQAPHLRPWVPGCLSPPPAPAAAAPDLSWHVPAQPASPAPPAHSLCRGSRHGAELGWHRAGASSPAARAGLGANMANRGVAAPSPELGDRSPPATSEFLGCSQPDVTPRDGGTGPSSGLVPGVGACGSASHPGHVAFPRRSPDTRSARCGSRRGRWRLRWRGLQPGCRWLKQTISRTKGVCSGAPGSAAPAHVMPVDRRSTVRSLPLGWPRPPACRSRLVPRPSRVPSW